MKTNIFLKSESKVTYKYISELFIMFIILELVFVNLHFMCPEASITLPAFFGPKSSNKPIVDDL